MITSLGIGANKRFVFFNGGSGAIVLRNDHIYPINTRGRTN